MSDQWEEYPKTKSGITLVPWANAYADARAWVKLRGEPALRLYCTPQEFNAAYQSFMAEPGAVALVACDFLYGLPTFFFRHMVEELVYCQITMASRSEAKPTKGSIWLEPERYPEGSIWVELPDPQQVAHEPQQAAPD